MSVEKVKITQEQADAIERVKQYHRSQLERFKSEPNIFADYLSPLINMEIDAIEKALWGDYEIEPEFKVGDWAYNKQTNRVFQVIDGFPENMNNEANRELLRHATPEEISKEKERRWWAKHGRDVWELKKGDVLKHEYYITYVAAVDPCEYVVVGDEDEIRVNKDDFERMDRIFEIICFAEDREDLK